MYKLETNGHKVLDGWELPFNSFSEVEDFIEENWSNDADYWISRDGGPAMEYRDILSLMFG